MSITSGPTTASNSCVPCILALILSDISLVILDLIMPKMGGKQCLEELLKINPEAKVLVASGFAAEAPTKEALSSGAKGFVDKPCDMRQVLRTVRYTLDTE